MKKLFTIGVEEEYMICNKNTYDLINKADNIMNNLSKNELDIFSYELLLSEIESNTSICKTVDQAIKELISNRNRLKDIGEKNNFRIGISGTHPTALPKDQSFVNNDSYNWVTKELKEYSRQNITFSTHIHIGLDSNDTIIQVLNVANGWIAPMIALCANSPFFGGKLTGMQSSRTFQFGLFPRTNILHKIKNYDEYSIIVKKLKECKSINKNSHLWWKIRPHIGYSTIEFRVCDIQRSLRNTEMIIAITQSLVHKIYHDIKNNKINPDYNMEFLNDSVWKASSLGIKSKLICPRNEKLITMKNMIYSMLDFIYPSLVYFGTENIIETVENILKNHTEAEEQIEIYHKLGFDGLKKFLVENVDYALN